MRRLAGIVVAVVAAVAVAASLGARGDAGSGYKVRAIFDNAASVVPGEDVKVAGVKVGTVDSLDVTAAKHAAVVFEVDSAGFTPFHTDATCTIRPQSLIGEKYVECEPGSNGAPFLPRVAPGHKGAADGQHLLPLANTSSPVDIDLIGNINRLPVRQRLTLIINEFGTALAGRGGALNQAIRRANPALRQTDQVLAILAAQNRTLAQLAHDSDVVVAPLAARRQSVAHFIVAANQTAQATAERSADIVRSFQLLPPYLRQLKPTLQDLGSVAQQSTPVLADLNQAAPSLNQLITELGPFSTVATPAIQTLGQATDVGGPALVKSQPTLTKLATFAGNANPVGNYLDELTSSLDRTGGLEAALNYIFFQTTAINGFDAVSHYLRAGLLTNLCSTYAVDPVSGCSANFAVNKTVRGARAAQDKVLARTAAALRAAGGKPAPKGRSPQIRVNPLAALRSLSSPAVRQQRANSQRLARGSGSGVSNIYGPTTANDAALNYLLGNGGQ